MEIKRSLNSVGVGIVAAKVEQYNKRAGKLGVEPLVIEVSDAYLKEIPTQTGTKSVLYKDIIITGEMPVLDGWEMIGVINHKEGCIVFGEVPNEYRNRQFCDHCNSSRKRNKTVLVRNEGGEIKQLGTQCLKDFIGGHSLDHALFLAEFWEQLEESCSESNDFGGSAEWVISLEQYLSKIKAIINKFGWKSKSKARIDGSDSTVARFWRAEVEGNFRREYSGFKKDEDMALIVKAIEWAASLPASETEDNDYLYNLSIVAKKGFVTVATDGLAASILSAYDKSLPEEVDEDAGISEWVGEIGDRLDLEVVVSECMSRYSDFSEYMIVKMKDNGGNSFVWFSGSKLAYDMKVDEKYNVRGTVKKHGEFKGMKNTQLTRVKVVS